MLRRRSAKFYRAFLPSIIGVTIGVVICSAWDAALPNQPQIGLALLLMFSMVGIYNGLVANDWA